MRSWMLLPLLLVAACSDAEAPPKEKAAAADATMQAGQWQMTSEVTRLTQHDEGAPAIDTPEGTKSSFAGCVAEADRKRPPATLFAGEEAQCEYRDFYMARGRMNATMECTLPGVAGEVVSSIEGNHDAESFEGTMATSTRLPGSGDVTVNATITGRHVGQCPAPATE